MESSILKEAIAARHSVRAYRTEPIAPETLSVLRKEIAECNEAGGLHMQLVTGEQKAFTSLLAKYCHFTGVSNYVAMVGREAPDLEERCGYWGERIVLAAQALGLNSCWVGLMNRMSPGAFEVGEGEKLVLVIALGYGVTGGKPHRSKPLSAVTRAEDPMPDWFRAGAEAALLAPTAVNQQKFTFTLLPDGVRATAGAGFFSRLDLGIVKLHFELGSGKGREIWK